MVVGQGMQACIQVTPRIPTKKKKKKRY